MLRNTPKYFNTVSKHVEIVDWMSRSMHTETADVPHQMGEFPGAGKVTRTGLEGETMPL